MGRIEQDRREIMFSDSPLKGHSLNQKNLRDQRQGALKVFGRIERQRFIRANNQQTERPTPSLVD